MDLTESRRRRQLLEQANEQYALLRANGDEAAEYDAELRLWEVTLGDGLAEYDAAQTDANVNLP